jgi:hypothetical protein
LHITVAGLAWAPATDVRHASATTERNAERRVRIAALRVERGDRRLALFDPAPDSGVTWLT